MPTTKAHFEAIGRVAYEWSRLELFVQTLIAVLAEFPQDTALIVTNSGTIRTWMETLRRIATHRQCPAEVYGRLKKLSEYVEIDLYRERNTVIHGVWDISWQELFGNIDEQPEISSKVVGLKKFGREMIVETRMTAAEVLAIADRINKAHVEFLNLTLALVDASRGTPQKTSLPASFPQNPQSSSQ